MHHRHPSRLSTITAIVVALLASRAGLAVAFAHEAHAATAVLAPAPADRSIDSAEPQPSEQDGPTRVALLRASAPAVTRVHASPSPTDGARGGAALGAASAGPALAAPRTPGADVDARAHGIASPGQPAPASRAPPIA
jgi:hypothetical protein